MFQNLKRDEENPNLTVNPYAGKVDGEWIEGYVSISFLDENFSQYETAEKMINATESEGLKLYFAWLKDRGILN